MLNVLETVFYRQHHMLIRIRSHIVNDNTAMQILMLNGRWYMLVKSITNRP